MATDAKGSDMGEEQVQTLREWNPANQVFAERGALLMERRFEYLVAKRDALKSQIRLGALTLHGASIAGVVSLLATKQAALAGLGISVDTARDIVGIFIVGAIAAILSLVSADGKTTLEVADAYSRMLKAQWLAATFENKLDPQNVTTMQDAMEDFHGAELVDFQYSVLSMGLQNISGALWIAGAGWAGCCAFGIV